MDLNLFWCIMGIVGSTFFSLIISLLFYIKSKKRQCLTYEIKTTCVISNKIQQVKELEVRYKAKEIENLYYSTITIKNTGNVIVKKEDLDPLYPISMLTSGQFLNTEHYYIESSSQDKEGSYDLCLQDIGDICKYIEFVFDYIPQKTTITFSLFHTGEIKFNGTLMDGKIVATGSPKITDKNKNSTPPRELISAITVLIGSTVAALTTIIASLLNGKH